MCDEWVNDFKNFMGWALGNGYQDDLTIDRRIAGKGYSPNNCRWVSIGENVKNKKITKETRRKISEARKKYYKQKGS